MTERQREHVELYGFYIPFGAELLNLLHAELQRFDLAQSGNHALYRDICLSMLCYTSVPYASILSKWLGLDSCGVLDDPYQEFFISTHDQAKQFQVTFIFFLSFFILELILLERAD